MKIWQIGQKWMGLQVTFWSSGHGKIYYSIRQQLFVEKKTYKIPGNVALLCFIPFKSVAFSLIVRSTVNNVQNAKN